MEEEEIIMNKFYGVMVWLMVFGYGAVALAQDATPEASPVVSGVADADMVLLDTSVDKKVGEELAALPADGEVKISFSIIGQIIKAVQDKNFGLAAALVMMLLVWVVRRYWKQINVWFSQSEKRKRWFGWVAAGVTAIGYIGTSMVAGGEASWLEVVLVGLELGVAQVGLWKLVGEPILGKPKTVLADPAGEG